VNLKILLFNNRIYGLTKGQYSPTSELGKVTKSTPLGSLDHPFNPLSIADRRRGVVRRAGARHGQEGLTDVLGAAARHRGRVRRDLQNCNIYNDGAFDYVRDEQGEPHLPRGTASGSASGEGEKGRRAVPGRLASGGRRR
jgi:2-oxoglutarate ferredoxin oxidoreductase subunit beta